MPKGNTPVESSTQNTSAKTGISRRSFLKGTGAAQQVLRQRDSRSPSRARLPVTRGNSP